MSKSRVKKEAFKKGLARVICLILAIAMVASTFVYLLYYLLQ